MICVGVNNDAQSTLSRDLLHPGRALFALWRWQTSAPRGDVYKRQGWSRRNACRVLTLLIMACGIPVSLSFGPWADYTLFGKTLFDLLDYLTSNLMMPLFGLVLTLLLGWKLGDSIVPADLSPLMRGALLWCWRLVAPLLIAGILVRGLL